MACGHQGHRARTLRAAAPAQGARVTHTGGGPASSAPERPCCCPIIRVVPTALLTCSLALASISLPGRCSPPHITPVMHMPHMQLPQNCANPLLALRPGARPQPKQVRGAGVRSAAAQLALERAGQRRPPSARMLSALPGPQVCGSLVPCKYCFWALAACEHNSLRFRVGAP